MKLGTGPDASRADDTQDSGGHTVLECTLKEGIRSFFVDRTRKKIHPEIQVNGKEKPELELEGCVNPDEQILLLGIEPDEADEAARSEEHTSELQSRPHLVC